MFRVGAHESFEKDARKNRDSDRLCPLDNVIMMMET